MADANKLFSTPVYFWIAEYHDGTTLPQFDPNGTENPFSALNHKKLKAFGWYPFSFSLARAVVLATDDRVFPIPRELPLHRITLKDGEELAAKKTTLIKFVSFLLCRKCGSRWKYRKPKTDFVEVFYEPLPKESKRSFAPSQLFSYYGRECGIDLTVSRAAVMEKIRVGEKIVEFVSPVCPNCGYYDCNAMMKNEKQIIRVETQKKKSFYFLGVKSGCVICINEDGEIVENAE